MHFFNIDLHISVIADVTHVLESLGHRVTSWNMSGHNWVFGREPAQLDVVTPDNWHHLDETMCEQFLRRYKSTLSTYDGFIVTYPPAFALLFAQLDKPIIVVAATRYEYPFTNRPAEWSRFNDFLTQGIDSGQVVALANNRYDAAYAEYFTGRRWRVIPSLCEYTGVQYNPKNKFVLYSSKLRWPRFIAFNSVPHSHLLQDCVEPVANIRERLVFSRMSRRLCPRSSRKLDGILPLGINSLRRKERELRQGHTWHEMASFQGYVHVPYNASTMSFFEQYTAAVPLVFPTESLLVRMYERFRDCGVMSELSWNAIIDVAPGSRVEPRAANGRTDPNRFDCVESMLPWIRLSDFYDQSNFAHVQYFDSLDELRSLVAATKWNEISDKMRTHNIDRRRAILEAWRGVLEVISKA
ncbi:MAG: hypothetical protein ACK5Q5_12320 [Planctomycetaceae bacterium]